MHLLTDAGPQISWQDLRPAARPHRHPGRSARALDRRTTRGRAGRAFGDDAGPDTLGFLVDTDQNVTGVIDVILDLREALDTLHDVRSPKDRRVHELVRFTEAATVAVPEKDPWIPRLTASLLKGEIWAACLRHVRGRDTRVRELMAATGVQELFNAQDRVLNASLRVAATPAERQKVTDWFGEMASYAWWPGDDLPTIVRRCLAQEGGDCTRIGPTEITALATRMDEQSRIVADWTRRLFIGMWNALPAVGLLFVVELAILVMGVRRPAPVVMPVPAALPEDDYRLRLEERGRRRLTLTR